MTNGRPTPFDDAAYAEGRESEQRGISYHECPYLFGSLNVTQDEFDCDYRAKMNGWTYGWIDARSARQLTSNLPPAAASQGDKP